MESPCCIPSKPPQAPAEDDTQSALDRTLENLKQSNKEKQAILIDVESYKADLKKLQYELTQEREKSVKLENFIRNVALKGPGEAA